MKPKRFALSLSLLLLAASARAATGWLCDATAKTLTEVGVEEGETPWVLSWDITGVKFRITGAATEGSGGFLDLSLPVAEANGTPRSIEVIGGNSFRNRSAIRRLRFADSTTEIGGSSFSGCAYLERIVLPHGMSLRTSRPWGPDCHVTGSSVACASQ